MSNPKSVPVRIKKTLIETIIDLLKPEDSNEYTKVDYPGYIENVLSKHLAGVVKNKKTKKTA